VALKVRARKYFCDRQGCERRIFCERLAEVSARSRKTAGLEKTLLSITLRLGSEAGTRLARRLGLPVSPEALLERARKVPNDDRDPVRVLGVGDFAFKKGTRTAQYWWISDVAGW
jgi:hypothetical protein